MKLNFHSKYISVLIGTSMLFTLNHTQAASYPDRPIELVVGYGAGGVTDVCVRALAQGASDELDTPIVIENKPGASSSLSLSHIVRQKPDGYRLAVLATGGVLNQFMRDDVDYDVLDDLTLVSMFAQLPFGILVQADSPMKELNDILKKARENPGSITYSTAGVGSPQHLTTVALEKEAGVELNHIPYKSGTEAATALLRGDVDFMADVVFPGARDERYRLMTIYTDERLEEFDEVPTLKDEGFDLASPSILGMAGPKGMDEQVIKKLEQALTTGMNGQYIDDC